MERGDLIRSVFKFFKILPGKLKSDTNHQRELIPQDEFFYYSLIPVAFAVAAFAFLQRRRWKRLHLLDGRPGVPCPINFLEDKDNRLAYVAAFGLTSWTAWDALTGDIPFEWSHENRFVKNFARLSTCLMSALICYPIFGSIASDHVIGYAIGSAYIWMYATVYLLSNYPHAEDGRFLFTIQTLQILPATVCIVYLCFQLPWRCWKRGVKQWRRMVLHSSISQSMWKEDVRSSGSYHYVRNLLAANRTDGIEARKRIMQIARGKIYKNIPGFRYSLSILIGVLVSIQFVYVGSLDVLKFYKGIIDDLRKPLLPPAINASLPFVDTVKEFELSPQGSNIINEYKAWLDAFELSCYISVILSFISTTAAVLLTLRNYRRHLLLLYRGQRLPIVPLTERNWKPTSIVANAAKYVGFQFGYAIWGFVYQSALLLAICFGLSVLYMFSFRYHKLLPILNSVFNVLGPITVYISVLLVVQRVLVRFCFLQRDDRGRLVLAFDNRRLLWNFQYFMVFANSTMGLVSCFVRIFKASFICAWILPRLDVSMMNRHFERFDNGYSAYAALLAVESCHTNPVLVIFVKLLWLTQFDQPRVGSAESLREIIQTDQPGRSKSSRTKLIRNRWHLYVTLHHNPGLRLLRKESIRIDRLMHAEEVVLDDELIEAPRLRLLLRRLSDRKDLDDDFLKSWDKELEKGGIKHVAKFSLRSPKERRLWDNSVGLFVTHKVMAWRRVQIT